MTQLTVTTYTEMVYTVRAADADSAMCKLILKQFNIA